MSPILTLQKRMMELGRFRAGGEKETNKPGRKLENWRVTSASKTLLQAIADLYGGNVEPWPTAPDDGYWQVYTETSEVHGMFPPIFSDVDGTPTVPLSQFFENWDGGSCQRRCDGVTETMTGSPCLCAPVVATRGEDGRVCKPTTRLSFMLPDIPGLGVWRAESRGFNAAVEMPQAAQVLQQAAMEGRFIPMVLRLEARTVKKAGEQYPRRFVVPVIDLPSVTVRQLASGEAPTVLNAPAASPARVPRPELPAGPEPPADPKFNGDEAIAFGEPPPLPSVDPVTPTFSADAEAMLTKRLIELAGGLRKKTETVAAVKAHRESHTYEEHMEWLGRFITRLKALTEEKMTA